MTPKCKTLAGVTALFVALTISPAMAQDAATWDADGDTALTQEEFATGFNGRGILGDWDQDADGLLSEDEFGQGVYGTYDRDLSGDLSEDEYGIGDDMAAGAPGFWGDDEVGYDYEAWDIDGDGILLSNEFADGFGEIGTLGEWDIDGDGALSEDEFSTGVFGEYDADGTGLIEEPELTDIGDDMGDEGFWDV